MESKNTELLNLGKHSQISDEKLELRLAPPASQVDEDQSNSLVYSKFSNKRAAPASVVGWPPVRSFRKKMAASSFNMKPSMDPPQSNGEDKGELKVMVNKSSSQTVDQQFVKVNMDGIPIGRKVDLRKYDNYQSLSSAVDNLFRGLLAAQEGSWEAKPTSEQEGRKEITGLRDRNAAYTLVYEDNEGDRVLVGDVPWNMFLSTVKRLRVLKRSDVGAKLVYNKLS
ncbi:hypothetical protein V2J09_004670 [Rumex salicifolius]